MLNHDALARYVRMRRDVTELAAQATSRETLFEQDGVWTQQANPKVMLNATVL